MSQNDVLVSIVMTCYNQESYVCDAIKSVIEQSYANWQLVIVNDCSSDHSLKTIRKFCEKNNIMDKVKIISHSKNRGYGISLNDAIVNSDGELVGILDADDILFDKDAIKISVKKHLEYPDVSLTYSNYNECDRNLKMIFVYRTRQIMEDESFLRPKRKVRVSHFKMLKKRLFDLTEGINPKLKQTVDKDLVLKMEEVGKLLFINKTLYSYRKHNKNLTRTIRKKGKDYEKFVVQMRREIYESARQRRKNKK